MKSMQELEDITRAIADGVFSKEANQKLTSSISGVVESLEGIRGKFLTVEPSLVETTEELPRTTEHLSAVNKTILDAAETLMTLTEKGIDDNNRATELLNKLSEQIVSEDGNKEALGTVEELLAMNEAAKGDHINMMTALSFQDLAGQRLKKITSLIEGVESKLLEILLVFGYTEQKQVENKMQMLGKLQQSKGALKQDLVDDVLKEFGL